MNHAEQAEIEAREFARQSDPEVFRQRPCGDCTVCCVAPAVEAKEIEPGDRIKPKPAGTACEHCTGVGCAIYAERPGICRGYLCTYALGWSPTYPKETGVAFTPQVDFANEKVFMKGHTTGDCTRLLSEQWFLEEVGRMLQDFPAVIVAGEQNTMMLSGGQVLVGLVDPNDPLKMRIMPETVRPLGTFEVVAG